MTMEKMMPWRRWKRRMKRRTIATTISESITFLTIILLFTLAIEVIHKYNYS